MGTMFLLFAAVLLLVLINVPIAVSLGIVSVTAMWRKHMGPRFWKAVHLAGYGVFITATAHGLMAGTDSGEPWMLGIYIVSIALVAGVAARRLIAGPNAPLKKRRQAAATAP